MARLIRSASFLKHSLFCPQNKSYQGPQFSKSCDQTPLTNMDNHVESIHETAPSITDASTDGAAIDSKASVAIPSINVEALALEDPSLFWKLKH